MDPRTFKYGQPLFAAAWPHADLLLVAGGGGKAGSGIENRIIAATYKGGALSDELASVRLKKACEKMAVSRHTNLVLAVTESGVVPYNLRLVDGKPHFIMPQSSVIDAFAHLTERVTAVRFSDDAELLVLGTISGIIHIWDAAQLKAVGSHKLQSDGNSSEQHEIKDLDILRLDQDGNTLLEVCATTEGGDCHVVSFKCKLAGGKPSGCKVQGATALKKPSTVQYGALKHCRFVEKDVVCTLNFRGKGWLCRWQHVTAGLYKHKRQSVAMPAAVTGMDTSADGDLVGVVNSEGHTMLMDASTLQIRNRNKKAHMVFGTDVAFSKHVNAYLTVSGDASARVSEVPEARSGGMPWLLLLLLVVGVLVAVYMLREKLLEEAHVQVLEEVVGKVVSTVEREVSSLLSSSQMQGLKFRLM